LHHLADLRASYLGGICQISRTDHFLSDLFTAVVTGKRELGGSQELSGPFWKSTVIAGLLGGEVWVAETLTTPKKIVGCAVWFGPGRAMYDRYALTF
jgi:hypothetical protein